MIFCIVYMSEFVVSVLFYVILCSLSLSLSLSLLEAGGEKLHFSLGGLTSCPRSAQSFARIVTTRRGRPSMNSLPQVVSMILNIFLYSFYDIQCWFYIILIYSMIFYVVSTLLYVVSMLFYVIICWFLLLCVIICCFYGILCCFYDILCHYMFILCCYVNKLC